MPTYYVSKSVANGYVIGSDSNNGTAKSTPWLTISKAVATAVDGDTVYVNDGTYVDLELGAASVISINSAKSLKMYPETAYGVTIQSTAGSAQIVSLTGTATNEMIFGKFVIDAEIPGAPGTYQPTCLVIPNTAGDCTLTLAGTCLKNAGTQHLLNSRRRGTMNLDLVFSGRIAQGVASTTSGADVAAMTVNVTSLALDATVSVNALCRVLDFTRLSTSAQSYSLTVSNVTGSIVAPAALGSSAAIALLVATGIQGVIAQDFNVRYTVYNASATSYGVYIKNSARGATAVANRPIVRRNTIVANAPTQYCISIGDTTTAYDVDHGLVYANTITVPYYASDTPHCIAIGNVTGGLAYGNTTYGGYVGILLGINQGAVVTGNLCVGCYGFALYSKGCGATTRPIMCQNTVVLTNQFGAARAAALGVAIQGATNNADTLFQNNVVYAQTALYRYVDVGTSQAATFVKNDYYSAGPTGFTSPWSYQSSLYTTFAAWAAAHETEALNVDPLFTSYNQFNTRATSPLRRTGTWCTNAARDHRGRPCLVPPDIGAYQASKNDPR